jgi:hypothetical protein
MNKIKPWLKKYWWGLLLAAVVLWFVWLPALSWLTVLLYGPNRFYALAMTERRAPAPLRWLTVRVEPDDEGTFIVLSETDTSALTQGIHVGGGMPEGSGDQTLYPWFEGIGWRTEAHRQMTKAGRAQMEAMRREWERHKASEASPGPVQSPKD